MTADVLGPYGRGVRLSGSIARYRGLVCGFYVSMDLLARAPGFKRPPASQVAVLGQEPEI